MEINDILRAAQQQGWVLARSKRHQIWRSPDGRSFVSLSVSPSHPSRDRILKEFRQKGLKL